MSVWLVWCCGAVWLVEVAGCHGVTVCYDRMLLQDGGDKEAVGRCYGKTVAPVF